MRKPRISNAIVDGKRRCRTCDTYKDFSEFWKDKSITCGLSFRCKPCWKEVNKTTLKRRSEAARRYVKRHPDRERNRRLRQRYGISQDIYDQMFREQNGVCAICEYRYLDGRILVVDHDHKTGKVRGLLCRMCNWFIGRIKENPQCVFDYLNKKVTA